MVEVKLDSRGRRLWAELVGDDADGDLLELIIEACRTADRLERLDWACRRDGIIELVEIDGHDGVTEVRVGNALGEARQQGVAFRQLLNDIRRRRDAEEQSGEDDPLDDL